MTSDRRRLPLRHYVTAAAVVLVAVMGVMLAGRDDRGPRAPAPPPLPDTSEAAPPPAITPTAPTADASAPSDPPAEVRMVGGPGITPPPASDEPPVRVAPPKKPEPPPPPIVQRRLGLVKMEDTAHFSVGAIHVRLPGVVVTGPDEICRDRAGTAWPCGRRALAGVRAVVRGRAVDCPLPDKVRRGEFVTDCTLAGADMAERLVASGWTRALDRDGPLGAADREAEAKGLGLHGTAMPIGVDPFPDPGEVPPDRTTAPLAGGAEAPAPDAPTEAGAAGNVAR
jgi:endonuclease YncB( thermonuclease family)